MPVGLTSVDAKLLAGAAVAALALTIGSVVLTDRAGDTREVPTTYSSGSDGAKAAYLLLAASGYHVVRWERPLRQISEIGATLVLAGPEEAPTDDDRAAIDRFIERGGLVIATGVSGGFFLPEHHVAADPIAGMTWKRMSAQSPSAAVRDAPQITLAPAAFWDRDTPAVPLYGDNGRARVVTYGVGKGVVMWWASATPLTNAGLREPGNLEFLFACLGDPRRTILWDEYLHGYRESAASPTAHRSPLTWIGLQIAGFVAAVLVTYSRRSGPIVAPAAESRLSPLEFVRTLGSLYRHAGAAPVAVDIAYQRFKYRFTQTYGLTANATSDELRRAYRDRGHPDAAAFGELVTACEAARHDGSLTAKAALRLNRSLYRYAAELDLFRVSRKGRA